MPSSGKMRPLIDGDKGGIPAVEGGRGRCRAKEKGYKYVVEGEISWSVNCYFSAA